jgi:hypothetical protein
MSYTVNIRATKPSDSPWFIAVDPVTVQKIRDWQNTVPGLVDFFITEVDENTIISSMIWEQESDYESYLVACQQNEWWNIRNSYNETIGVITTVEL